MSEDISLSEAERSAGIVRCDACPVLCRIRPGRAGACDRYANEKGALVRVDPLVLLAKPDLARVAFVEGSEAWRGELGKGEGAFVTGIGATTTYPDYKPAPFIVSSKHDGVDMVTVVTEGIFSYCGVKVKIDTDRYLGPEQAAVRVKGEAVGHVTTAEYGSQMLSLGGVHHLTGGSKKEGVVTCDALLALCNREAVELTIDGGSTVIVQAGRPPVVNGVLEERMRVGCGSAAIGMFAPQWLGSCRRGGRGRRPHHRRAERAPGRRLSGHEAGRHPRARAQVDPGPLFPGGGAGTGLGRHRCQRSAGDHREDRSEAGLARPEAADGVDHRRTFGLVHPRRRAETAADRDARAGASRRRAHRRELRAGTLYRSVHGRRRRLAARGRYRESGASHALGARHAHQGHVAAACRRMSGRAAASR
jgi:hypothetical protein